MSDGRTVWRAKDAAWWRREWIVELGEEFGSDGPAVIDWLECEAKAQNDGGLVSAGRRTVARGCFVDLVTVGHVLSRSVTLGLLENFEERGGRFSCRISGWKAEQDRAMAARRKAEQRAVTPGNTGIEAPAVTVSHGESRPVTKCPPTGQDRTVVKQPSSSERSASDLERGKASDDDRRLCRLFAEKVRARNPKAKIPKAGQEGNWLREMRLLRTADKNPAPDIERIILWLFTDPGKDAIFWGSTVQSPSGLRSNFSQIWSKVTAEPSLQAVRSIESSADFLARRGAA